MGIYIYLIISFLIGGIPFGLLAGFAFGKGDIRTGGSGNIGATNAWRVAGPAAAAVAFVGDIGKGVVAVLLSSVLYHATWPLVESAAALLGGLMAILGHTLSPYLKFRGGKGVNTALGVFVTLLPIETLISFAVFLLAVLSFRYISLGSILGGITLAAVTWIERFAMGRMIDDLYLTTVTAMALLIVLTHRQNIARLVAGSENKFSFKDSRR
jgi:glycerol-3-phosphate acyltransferase PlsY